MKSDKDEQMSEEKGICNVGKSFIESSPREVLEQILSDDRLNYDDASKKFSHYIKVLDNGIILFIVLLQEAHRHPDDWKNNVSLKAAIMMASAALNYILLERHGILMGYYPETRDLSRSCYERMTRCLAFSLDANLAKKFTSGGIIWQKDVDKILTKYLAKANKHQDNTLKELRANYKFKSGLVHPNVSSMEARTGTFREDMFKDGEIIPCWLGGMMSDAVFKPLISSILEDVVFALMVLRLVIKDTSGHWDRKLSEIREIHNKLTGELMEQKPKH